MSDRVGQQLGNYRLTRLLGQGGFAEVYLGGHIHLNTLAAIKVLYTQFASDDIEKFRTEARMIARLLHPSIVRILDFGVEGNTPFLVMDYAPQGSLRQLHPKGTKLPSTIVVTYIKQIAEALQYAHDEKLIHRDVKPENMLVGRRNEVLLSDFGIATMAQSSRYHSTQDMAGTIAYMAPEQIQAHPRPASDQYSLGIVAYEWLSGERPFDGSFTEIAIKHSIVPPPPLSEKIQTIPPTIEEVIMKALAKDPKERFASVQEFAAALEQASISQTPMISAITPNISPQIISTTPTSTPTHETLLLTFQSNGEIDLLAWSPNGKFLALRSSNLIEIKDATNGDTIFAFQGESPKLYPQDHLIVPMPTSEKPRGFFKKQPTKPTVKKVSIYSSSSAPPTVAWSPSAQIIAIANSDGTIMLWDAETRSVQWTIDIKTRSKFGSNSSRVYQGRSIEVVWSKDGSYITFTFYYREYYSSFYYEYAYERNFNRVDILDVNNKQWIFDLEDTEENHIIKLSPTRDQIALVKDTDKKDTKVLKLYDVATKGLNFSHTEGDIYDLAWSQDGKQLIIASVKGISVWDASLMHRIKFIVDDYIFPPLEHKYIIWSPDEKVIVIRNLIKTRFEQYDHRIEFWNIENSKKILHIKYDPYIQAIDWSSDMQIIFCVFEWRVEVWNISSAKKVSEFTNTFAISTDGTRIATTSHDKTLQLWEVTTQKHLFSFPGYAGRIKFIAWAPDGNRLAITLNDSTIQILQAQ